MTKRKSPIKHRVHLHIRDGKLIHSYDRGSRKNSPRLAKPTIYKPSTEKHLLSLFELQSKLIEHKYPIPGVWEHMLTHVGDIFRGITRGKSNSAYIMEKLGRLERYFDNPINREDFKDFKYYSDGGYYEKHKHEGGVIKKYSREAVKLRKAKYFKNLSKLIDETQKVEMDPKRKEAMLNALDVTEKIANYFETGPIDLPYLEFKKLKTSVETYLGEQE